MLGSHSVALDKAGRLYAWGLPHACGVGVTKAPLRHPALVDLSALVDFDTMMSTPTPAHEGEEDASTPSNDTSMLIKDVACGSCFTVVVLRSGRVASWGVYDSGRLGQGQPPMMNTARSSGGNTATRIVTNAILQRIGSDSRSANRHVGDTSVDDNSSSSGGSTSTSRTKYMKYCLSPKYIDIDMSLLLPASVSTSGVARTESAVKAVSIVCGEMHSLVLLNTGQVLAWGSNTCGMYIHSDHLI